MKTGPASLPPEGLLRAFAAADYRATIAAREYTLRPGRRHQALDRALDGRPWAVITAFNPRARRIPDRHNQARHQQLLRAVTGLGLDAWPAVNRDPQGGWPDETGVLVVDAQARQLDALADRFDQAAVLTGRPGQPARLRLYGSDWPQQLPAWAERTG